MKSSVIKRFILAMGSAALLLVSSIASAAVINTVKFSQGTSISTSNGANFTVDVVGENFSSLAPDGAGFSLRWDPAVLQYQSTAFTNPTWTVSSVDASQSAIGLIDPVFLGILATNVNAGANFGIASFTFHVLGNAGSSTALTLANDKFDTGFINGTSSINVNYVNSQVQVVPVPATVWLFGSALTGAIGLMKRRKVA